MELTSDQQDALRASAITAVESYCRQRFLPDGSSGDPVRRRLDGTGTNTLYLPVRLSELISLSVLEGAGSVGADDVSLSDDRTRLTVGGTTFGSSWAERAIADAEGHREPVFPAGVDNIAVEGVWGWTDAEYTADLAAVTTALRFDMEDKALAGANHMSDTVRSARALGVNSISQGRLSLNLAAIEPDLSVRAQRAVADLVAENVAGAAF